MSSVIQCHLFAERFWKIRLRQKIVRMKTFHALLGKHFIVADCWR